MLNFQMYRKCYEDVTVHKCAKAYKLIHITERSCKCIQSKIVMTQHSITCDLTLTAFSSSCAINGWEQNSARKLSGLHHGITTWTLFTYKQHICSSILTLWRADVSTGYTSPHRSNHHFKFLTFGHSAFRAFCRLHRLTKWRLELDGTEHFEM